MAQVDRAWLPTRCEHRAGTRHWTHTDALRSGAACPALPAQDAVLTPHTHVPPKGSSLQCPRAISSANCLCPVPDPGPQPRASQVVEERGSEQGLRSQEQLSGTVRPTLVVEPGPALTFLPRVASRHTPLRCPPRRASAMSTGSAVPGAVRGPTRTAARGAPQGQTFFPAAPGRAQGDGATGASPVRKQGRRKIPHAPAPRHPRPLAACPWVFIVIPPAFWALGCGRLASPKPEDTPGETRLPVPPSWPGGRRRSAWSPQGPGALGLVLTQGPRADGLTCARRHKLVEFLRS